jgi:polar amino acid transport system substrate-binding protein
LKPLTTTYRRVTAQQFQRSASAISRNPHYAVVPRRHPHAAVLIEQFNEGLAALPASGDYQHLEHYHLEQRDASATL